MFKSFLEETDISCHPSSKVNYPLRTLQTRIVHLYDQFPVYSLCIITRHTRTRSTHIHGRYVGSTAHTWSYTVMLTEVHHTRCSRFANTILLEPHTSFRSLAMGEGYSASIRTVIAVV
jgi:hypothetical protein